jgi:hypothetical protein
VLSREEQTAGERRGEEGGGGAASAHGTESPVLKVTVKEGSLVVQARVVRDQRSGERRWKKIRNVCFSFVLADHLIESFLTQKVCI